MRSDYLQRIRDRDGFVCLWGIGSPDACNGGIQIHHIIKRSQLGGDVDENLISLCAKHHEQAERRRISPEELQSVLAHLFGYTYEE